MFEFVMSARLRALCSNQRWYGAYILTSVVLSICAPVTLSDFGIERGTCTAFQSEYAPCRFSTARLPVLRHAPKTTGRSRIALVRAAAAASVRVSFQSWRSTTVAAIPTPRC